jgi:hypothetical protein
MARVTIVIEDQRQGPGRITVQTDAGVPSVGQQYTPAQILGNILLRTCHLQAEELQYGNASATLAGELLNCQQE